MNFYIGNSIDEINVCDASVEFSDELISFIYKLSKDTSFDMSKLYNIDPYDDVVIPLEDVENIIDVCDFVLKKVPQQDYEEIDEGNQMLKNLLEIAQRAKTRNLGLVSIGD